MDHIDGTGFLAGINGGAFFPSYSCITNNGFNRYTYQDPIRDEDNVIFVYHDGLADNRDPRSLAAHGLDSGATGERCGPGNMIGDHAEDNYDPIDGAFGSDLFAPEVIPLEVGIGFDPYGYSSDEKPLLLSLDSYENGSAESAMDFAHSVGGHNGGGDSYFLANHFPGGYSGAIYSSSNYNCYPPSYHFSPATSGHGCGSFASSNGDSSSLLFAAGNKGSITIKDGEYLVNNKEEEKDNIIFVSNDIETREEVVGDGMDPFGIECFGFVHEVKPVPSLDEPSSDDSFYNGKLMLDEFSRT